MADGASPTLSPKEAIAVGMKYFNELMESQNATRVLLEGLALDEITGNWVVTFGFDSERTKPFSESPLMAAVHAGSAFMRAPVLEIVREFRSVHLCSDDGKFVKLEHA